MYLVLFALICILGLWLAVVCVHFTMRNREREKQIEQLKKALICNRVMTVEQLRTGYY